MISRKKIQIEKDFIIKNCQHCHGRTCQYCLKYNNFIDLLAEADIPVDYWHRKMKGFYGHPDFRDGIMDYINNLEVNYYNGQSLCLTGHRGTGKTMAACCILKEALKKGYSVFYTTMVDAVANLLSSQSNDYRYDLKHIDFLIIDELDQRFFHTVNSNDLYGNHFENIFRIRVQNKLPTIICTNSEDVEQIFNGEFKESFISLSSQFLRILRASGKDVRKNKC